MKKVLKAILAVVVVAVLGVLIFAATKPDTFTVQRSAIINAPAEKIYPLIANFHQWSLWSPYDKLDPNMKKTYTGPASGAGAAYEWAGNDKAGEGKMTVTEAKAPSTITMDLDFTKPFQAHNKTEFTLQKLGASTVVTWRMTGPNPYISKVIGTFCDMDKLIGTDFEKGLHNLTVISETPAPKNEPGKMSNKP